MTLAYKDWSTKWTSAREYSGSSILESEMRSSINKIKRLWEIPIPREWERENWSFLRKAGFRRTPSSVPQPEHDLEKSIFARDAWTVVGKRFNGSLSPHLNELSFAKHRQGQRKIDILAILDSGREHSALAIEVKKAANNCWFAVVENLQQLRLLRDYPQDRLGINKLLKPFRDLQLSESVGMVLAPGDFFDHAGQKQNSFRHARVLARELQAEMGVTILLAEFDREKRQQIILRAG